MKRVNRIIDALKLLADQGIECKWIHMGGGKLLDNLSAYAAQQLDGTSVTYDITGTLPNREIMALLKKLYADCFVNVSENEGLPLSIMEAMSFGIPVIATNVGGTGEIVNHGQNGFLLDKDYSDEQLADLLRSFAQNNSAEFRCMARSRWEKDFVLRTNTIKMLHLCEQDSVDGFVGVQS